MLDVVIGNEMLDETALAEVKTAVFTEVLKLEVWMFLAEVGSIRIHFSN